VSPREKPEGTRVLSLVSELEGRPASARGSPRPLGSVTPRGDRNGAGKDTPVSSKMTIAEVQALGREGAPVEEGPKTGVPVQEPSPKRAEDRQVGGTLVPQGTGAPEVGREAAAKELKQNAPKEPKSAVSKPSDRDLDSKLVYSGAFPVPVRGQAEEVSGVSNEAKQPSSASQGDDKAKTGSSAASVPKSAGASEEVRFSATSLWRSHQQDYREPRLKWDAVLCVVTGRRLTAIAFMCWQFPLRGHGLLYSIFA
jgi:hypothetical protein